MVMAGVPLATVAAILGHADIKMVMRYAHLKGLPRCCYHNHRRQLSTQDQAQSQEQYRQEKQQETATRTIIFEQLKALTCAATSQGLDHAGRRQNIHP
jgi:hypothetical protein